jgi:hypothetical protein
MSRAVTTMVPLLRNRLHNTSIIGPTPQGVNQNSRKFVSSFPAILA